MSKRGEDCIVGQWGSRKHQGHNKFTMEDRKNATRNIHTGYHPASYRNFCDGVEPPALLEGAQLGLQPPPGQSDESQAFLHEWP